MRESGAFCVAAHAAPQRECLSENEQAVYKRGRNAAPKCTPKHGSVADYHSATGLEALFGYLYLNGEQERTRELFQIIIDNQGCP